MSPGAKGGLHYQSWQKGRLVEGSMADISDIINFGEEVECGRIEREEKIKSRNRINMTFIRK